MGRLDEHLLGNRGRQFGRSAAQNRVGANGIGLLRGPPTLELCDETDLVRIDVRDRDPLQPGTVDGDVHDAPVGQVGNGEPRDRAQRRLIVERGRQQRARLGEEGQAAVRELGLVTGPALVLVGLGLRDRERDAVSHQAEQPHVDLFEMTRLDRARMGDADHLLADHDRDRDERLDPALAKVGAGQLDSGEIADHDRRGACGDPACHPLAERDRNGVIDLAVEAERRADGQELALFVEQQDRARIRIEEPGDLAEHLVEHVARDDVPQCGLRDLLELREHPGGLLGRRTCVSFAAEELLTRLLGLHAREEEAELAPDRGQRRRQRRLRVA